eukprot:TRINITY_DN2924_c0_g3_i1.p1 TRINITY_DN2924_c0_g3~~TRINITY_DN2924_c0_g3_i1.p1  ORF type:complete len:163 (-),score=35.86 TRINITY_DN2924_c0_g3_i1:77-565(-)
MIRGLSEEGGNWDVVRKVQLRKRKGVAKAAKRNYVKVPSDKREELLRMIEERNFTVKAAAKRVRINYSTAKNIAKKFRDSKQPVKLVESLCEDEGGNFEKPNFQEFVMGQLMEGNSGELETLVRTPEFGLSKCRITEDGTPHFDFAAYSPLIYVSYAQRFSC